MSALACPVCKHPASKVINTRSKGDILYRRRECLNPKGVHRFSTGEVEMDWPKFDLPAFNRKRGRRA